MGLLGIELPPNGASPLKNIGQCWKICKVRAYIQILKLKLKLNEL